MDGAGDFQRQCRLRHGHVLERIKKRDRHLQFFVKKLEHVRHACASSAEENALRPASLLLRAVVTDGTHQLGVQPRHGAARYLRDAGNVGVCGLGIGASQTDEAVPLLANLRGRERLAEFPSNCGGDRIATDGKAARENFGRLNEENICSARSDIHQ